MAVRLETCDCGARDAKSDGAKYGLQFCACWSFTFDAGRFNQAIFTKSDTCHFNGFQRVAANYWIAYGVQSFRGFASFIPMALHMAITFLILAAGIFFARPSAPLAQLFATWEPRGVMARRLFPLAVLVTLLLGWLCV